ncbi:MAG: hypothetical protein IPG76_04800 [Acidobacteria bacterium]|nr:hypothetical protein [Acidobacteriota bacterium]MBK9705524.1 hypothetical protein [Acidobacteriota bacterium]
MHSETKHELLGALQYFLIGIIAEGCVIRWFDKNTGGEQMMIWIVIAFTLTVLRIVILFYAAWFRGAEWRSISRRRWD